MASRSRVGDYVSLQRGTTYQGLLVGKPGPALLGLGSIVPGGGFRTGDYKTYGGECPPKLMLLPGDLFVSLKGATKDGEMIGSVARVPSTVPSGRLTQDTVKLEFYEPAQDTKDFLYWLLRTPHYRKYCAARATGSAVVALSREDFLGYPVPPRTPERMTIVELLEALDNKIELNRRMNETLESTARALFKSWFVDFDPVRAKAEGRDPSLPKHVTDHFPDSFEASDTGEIPKGWSSKPFADTVEIIGGGTPKTSVAEYWDGDIPWFSVVDAPRDSDVWVINTEKRITQAGVDNSSTRILPERTTIISARGTVGRVALVGVPMGMNQSCYGLCGKLGRRCAFTYFSTRQLVSLLRQRAHGSVFDTITRETFAGIIVSVPPKALVDAYEDVVEPLILRIRTALFESHTLSATRDVLLPKLISGEIRIPDAERMVGVQV